MTAFLVVVAYTAAAVFVVGFTWRVLRWASTPVPFRIPTTAGQQRSLGFLPHSRLESPASAAGVAGRLALETLLFRSLFRNTGHRRHAGLRLSFPESRALWVGALVFHWSLLVILLRHVRLVAEPVPKPVLWLTAVDGFFTVGMPSWYASEVLALVALGWLLARRLREPLLRYVSQPADYAALGLLLLVAGSGVVTRHWARPDVVAVKEFTLGLVTLRPVESPAGWWFAAHVTLASVLMAAFPFTKLMHAAGAFLSPTRTLANDSRRVRHVNPWNKPVALHSYLEWESEFQEKIRAAGLPLDHDDGSEQPAANDQRRTTNEQ